MTNNSYLGAVGVRPCSILTNKGLTREAQIIANDYFNTNRLKQWNPSEPIYKSSDSNFDYCYFNFDVDQGLNDYMIGSNDCSKQGQFFKQSFIADVFEDSKHEKSYRAPFNKCIMKVDKAKLNNEELNNFWHRLDNGECTQLNNEAISTRDRLENQNVVCAQKVITFIESNNTLTRWINTENQKIEVLTQQISTCESNKVVMQSNINSNTNARNEMIIKIDNSARECNEYQALLQNSINSNSNNYFILVPVSVGNVTENNTLQEQFKELMFSISNVNSNLMHTTQLFESNIGYQTYLKSNIQVRTSNLEGCKVAMSYCKVELAACIANIIELDKTKALKTVECNICFRNQESCVIYKSNCDVFKEYLAKEKQDTWYGLSNCWSDLEICRNKVAEYQSSNNILTHEIEELLEFLRKCRFAPNTARAGKMLARLSNLSYSEPVYDAEIKQDSLDTKAAACAADTRDTQNTMVNINATSQCNMDTRFDKAYDDYTKFIGQTMTIPVQQHWMTCPTGFICPACDLDDAKKVCPKVCRESLVGKEDVEWTGEWHSVEETQTYCECSYTGTQANVTKADQSVDFVYGAIESEFKLPPRPDWFQKVCSQFFKKENKWYRQSSWFTVSLKPTEIFYNISSLSKVTQTIYTEADIVQMNTEIEQNKPIVGIIFLTPNLTVMFKFMSRNDQTTYLANLETAKQEFEEANKQRIKRIKEIDDIYAYQTKIPYEIYTKALKRNIENRRNMANETIFITDPKTNRRTTAKKYTESEINLKYPDIPIPNIVRMQNPPIPALRVISPPVPRYSSFTTTDNKDLPKFVDNIVPWDGDSVLKILQIGVQKLPEDLDADVIDFINDYPTLEFDIQGVWFTDKNENLYINMFDHFGVSDKKVKYKGKESQLEIIAKDKIEVKINRDKVVGALSRSDGDKITFSKPVLGFGNCTVLTRVDPTKPEPLATIPFPINDVVWQIFKNGDDRKKGFAKFVFDTNGVGKVEYRLLKSGSIVYFQPTIFYSSMVTASNTVQITFAELMPEEVPNITTGTISTSNIRTLDGVDKPTRTIKWYKDSSLSDFKNIGNEWIENFGRSSSFEASWE